jgi:hypothetical protein
MLRGRQHYTKQAALTRSAFELYPAAVGFDCSARDRQSQAHPSVLA